MNKQEKENTDKALAKISKDRVRTNILHNSEQRFLAYLVQRIPLWISSDMLTAIGFLGSIITFISFVLAKYNGSYWLLLGIVGFFINWFGDSTDGRVAFYRNKPRKWYGFSLDVIVDWWTDILIGFGFVFYVEGLWKWAGIAFILLYGWAIIMALLKYKITGKYIIDSNFVGPTEVRILICMMLILEVAVPDSLKYIAVLVCFLLFIFNLLDMKTTLRLGDERDVKEKEEKRLRAQEENERETDK